MPFMFPIADCCCCGDCCIPVAASTNQPQSYSLALTGVGSHNIWGNYDAQAGYYGCTPNGNGQTWAFKGQADLDGSFALDAGDSWSSADQCQVALQGANPPRPAQWVAYSVIPGSFGIYWTGCSQGQPPCCPDPKTYTGTVAVLKAALYLNLPPCASGPTEEIIATWTLDISACGLWCGGANQINPCVCPAAAGGAAATGGLRPCESVDGLSKPFWQFTGCAPFAPGQQSPGLRYAGNIAPLPVANCGAPNTPAWTLRPNTPARQQFFATYLMPNGTLVQDFITIDSPNISVT